MLGKLSDFFSLVIDIIVSVAIWIEELPSALVQGTRCPDPTCEGYLIAAPIDCDPPQGVAIPPQRFCTLVCTRCGHEETYLFDSGKITT